MTNLMMCQTCAIAAPAMEMHLRVAKVIHWLHYFNNIKDVLTHCLRASLRQLTPGLTQPVRGTILAITAMVLITGGVS